MAFTVDGRLLLDDTGRMVAEFTSDSHRDLPQFVACAVNRSHATTATHTEVCVRYLKGEAATVIADDLGVTVGRVYQVLRANGVPVRGQHLTRSVESLDSIEALVEELGSGAAAAKVLGISRQRVSQLCQKARKQKEAR